MTSARTDGCAPQQSARLWSADGNEIMFNGLAEVWGLSVEQGSKRKWIDLAGRPGCLDSLIAPPTDGEYLDFVWTEDLGDIWVMDVVTDESE